MRDLLLEKEPNDYDVATNATPDQVRDLFGRRRTLAVGESFGVVIVLGPKGSGLNVEVATFRSETGYHDGRRPTDVVFSTPEMDAQRRDFTINGMFFDPLSKTVHDFVGGKEDLQRKLVRAIGVPRDRMTEDKLRLLRAVRFAAVLSFDLDSETAAAVQEMAHQVIIVSAERIAQELRKMLAHPNRARAMRLLEGLRLLEVIFPEVHEQTVHISEESWLNRLHVLQRLEEASFELAMAALLRDVPCPAGRRDRSNEEPGTVLAVCRRLKLSNEETDSIVWLAQHRDRVSRLADAMPSEWKPVAAEPLFSDLFRCERLEAELAGEQLEPFDRLAELLRPLSPEDLNPPELLTGQDLIALGHTPGRQFKEWLKQIRDAQLNGEIVSKEEAIAKVRDMAHDPS